MAKDAGVALAKLNESVAQGVELNYLLLTLMRGLRDKLVAGEVEVGVTKLIFALDEVARKISSALDGELLVQTAIVEWCGSAMAENNQAPNNNNQTKTVSSWEAMKEKLKSDKPIVNTPAEGRADDIIEEAKAIFSN